jgi:hypothetical protein
MSRVELKWVLEIERGSLGKELMRLIVEIPQI